MIFHETGLSDCFLIEAERLEDERGFFARTFDAEEFRRRGLDPCVAQSSVSYNRTAGTLRGLHYQAPPHEEAKLVRCLRGSVFDVVVDLRPESSTRLQWRSFELSEYGRLAVYIPKGMAHGFMTITDDAELLYQISAAYVERSARGLRWDDPALDIAWPREPARISTQDMAWPCWIGDRLV